VAYLIACTSASAASIQVQRNFDNGTFAVFLEGGADNGNFDSFIFKAKPFGGATFTHQSSGLSAGQVRPPGEPFTYPNRLIAIDPLDVPGGLGLIMLGLVNVQTELSYVVGDLAGPISTASQPNGRLFLANLDVANRSSSCFQTTVTVELFNQGSLISHDTYVDPCPEPSAFALSASSLLAVSLVRRRGAP
jgi:hypothetical protein